MLPLKNGSTTSTITKEKSPEDKANAHLFTTLQLHAYEKMKAYFTEDEVQKMINFEIALREESKLIDYGAITFEGVKPTKSYKLSGYFAHALDHARKIFENKMPAEIVNQTDEENHMPAFKKNKKAKVEVENTTSLESMLSQVLQGVNVLTEKQIAQEKRLQAIESKENTSVEPVSESITDDELIGRNF